jgi:hypothetical protein
MAAIRSNVLTILRPRARTTRRLRARTRRHERIPPRAAAIPLRLAPTPHPATVGEGAAAIAAAEVAIALARAAVAEAAALAVVEARTVAEVVRFRTEAVAAEVHTAAVEEVPALTATTNLFLISLPDTKARPLNPSGPFLFRHDSFVSHPSSRDAHNSSSP